MENNLNIYIYICIKLNIYIKLNHFAVHLKLTQYCKSTILQLKKSTVLTEKDLHTEVFSNPETLTLLK